MATEREKMLRGELADTSDPELRELSYRAHKACQRLNGLTVSSAGYREALSGVIPGAPLTLTVMPPFHCDYGCNIKMGENVFVNYNCTFLDGGGIEIGDYTLIGPSVQIYTPQHPMDYVQRRKTIETSHKVTIGNDCWVGGGCIICPGVTIGDRTIIGAGSVVTKDIPSDSVAVGNPAKVIKKLNEVCE